MLKIIRENKILYTILGLILLFIIIVNLPTTYSNDLYKEYTNKTNKEMQGEGKELKGIAYSFSQDKKIMESYKDTMYDCLGFSIYNEKEDSSFSNTLDKCEKEYSTLSGTAVYYNQSWLQKDFSHWNGSYLPLERIIQKHLKQSKSYEHLKTSHTMNFEDKRPHMFVSIDFRGANIDGYMLDRTMEVKVDAKTKELYDLK